MRHLNLFAAALAFIPVADACDCGRAASAAEQAAGATVVFIGTAQRTVPSDEEGSENAYTVFTVNEVLKGDPGDPAYITHPVIIGMNCGIDFKDGADALVFAYAESAEAPLTTNACSMPQFPEEEVRAALKPETQSAP